MASAISTSKFLDAHSIGVYRHDPDGTSATLLTPDGGTTDVMFDMANYTHFAVVVMTSALTGNGVTKVEIVSETVGDGSGTVTAIKDSGTVAADAVGDQVALECSIEEVKQTAGATAQYLTARITVHNAADEAVVAVIRSGARFKYDGLTPATTIA